MLTHRKSHIENGEIIIMIDNATGDPVFARVNYAMVVYITGSGCVGGVDCAFSQRNSQCEPMVHSGECFVTARRFKRQ